MHIRPVDLYFDSAIWHQGETKQIKLIVKLVFGDYRTTNGTRVSKRSECYEKVHKGIEGDPQ